MRSLPRARPRTEAAWRKLVPHIALMCATPLLVQTDLHVAVARDGAPRTSKFNLYSDPLFHFSAPRLKTVAGTDCKVEEDAKAAFDAMGQTTILTWPASSNFLEKAYAGKLGFEGRIANVDHLAVVTEAPNRFQLFLGSNKILLGSTIFCGFSQPQIIDKEWAEAGFDNKTLFEQLPEYTEWQKTVMKLSSAYAGMTYTRVRSSLVVRGFKAVEQHDKPVDRCAPGLEHICLQYKEADCRSDNFDIYTCYFEWKSSDDESLGIVANVKQLEGDQDEIDVAGALELDPNQVGDEGQTTAEAPTQQIPEQLPKTAPKARQETDGERWTRQETDDPKALNAKWHDEVSSLITSQASNFAIQGSGSVSVRFAVSALGEISNIKILKSSGHIGLDKTATQMVEKVGHVRPPPGQQDTVFEIKIAFL